jgi:hypothetical protein
MKRCLFILTAFLFLISGAHAWAEADDSEGEVVVVNGLAAEEPEIEIIVLEDGTEEVQEILPASAYAPVMVDERYLAIQVDARQRIEAILSQIRDLADGSEEGELQKQIEQIKMDAEIERLAVLKADAENRGDDEMADELAYEIEHRARIDEPVIGHQGEQQPRQATE